MAETKWTPGPWRAAREDTIFPVYGDGERVGLLDFTDRQEANASLIAAAPELYEALKVTLAWLPTGEAPESVFETGYMLLAKARGEK